MKTIREDSLNYPCSVIKLPKKERIEGMDNLVKVTVFGNDCLISKDTPEEGLYVFFPTGSIINNELLHLNNAFRKVELNKNKELKGFFEENCRVRSLKLRGVVSTGFVTPISFLDTLNTIFKEGDEFTDVNDFNVCKKYIPKFEREERVKSDRTDKINTKLESLIIAKQFAFHEETTHLSKSLHLLQDDQIVVITDKWHGSSCILSNVLIRKKLNIFQKILKKVSIKVEDKKYGMIYSSGKPKSRLVKGVLDENNSLYKNNNGDYYLDNIWARAMKDYKDCLQPGITLYGELVGYTLGGSFIQKPFDYKCALKEYKFVIYRITYTDVNNYRIEFSWEQLKDYCSKYNLEHVKEFFYGSIRELKLLFKIETNEELYDKLITSFNLEKDCKENYNKVPAEGICLRIEGGKTFKLKSKKFINEEDQTT